MKKKNSIWFKIKAYKLTTQIWVTIVMTIIFAVSLGTYFVPAIRHDEVMSNIMLALFTSLLVTIFTLISDIFVSYKEHKNDEYLEDMKSYGIARLHRNKKEALQNMLSDCDSMIWISGYRLILTRELIPDLTEAMRRGAKVRAVICPPWFDAYSMVYKDGGKVMDNYYEVFNSLNQIRNELKEEPMHVEVFFVNKPIFSDTYRVDQNLITGAYMHNVDAKYHRLMAKDFFSYEIVKKSDLYEAVFDEFTTLCVEAVEILDWTNMESTYARFESEDWNEAQKIEEFHKLCVPKQKNEGQTDE